jgi:protein-disulfide isomerase
VLLLLAGAFFALQQPGQKAGPTQTSGQGEDSARAIGSAKAPVTVVEYGDFGCPTCRAWYKTATMEQILLEYGDQVRFVWRDFPVITPQSPKAAEAGLCAADQGEFWNYHNLIYSSPPGIGVSDLKRYAAQIGLDTQKFNGCLDSGQHKADVDRELQEGYAHGFEGTPDFLVNNHALIGPASFGEFKSVIDPLLAKGG